MMRVRRQCAARRATSKYADTVENVPRIVKTPRRAAAAMTIVPAKAIVDTVNMHGNAANAIVDLHQRTIQKTVKALMQLPHQKLTRTMLQLKVSA